MSMVLCIQRWNIIFDVANVPSSFIHEKKCPCFAWLCLVFVYPAMEVIFEFHPVTVFVPVLARCDVSSNKDAMRKFGLFFFIANKNLWAGLLDLLLSILAHWFQERTLHCSPWGWTGGWSFMACQTVAKHNCCKSRHSNIIRFYRGV